MTFGLGALDSWLNQKPMNKASAVGLEKTETVGQTEQKLNILVKASGVYKTDPDFKDSKRVNILLFGNTLNKSDTYGLTDTIMLGSFDPDTQKFDVISIPRDTYYERPEYKGAAWQKVNSILESEGIEKTAKIMHKILGGVQINYYAVIDYEGIANIVDSMGGVKIDVPRNMHYTDKKQNLYIDLKKGEQVLDGDHAIQYLRYRKGYKNGDIGRVEAQQKFVKEAIRQAIGLNLPKVANTVMENVDSDIDNRAILYLASKAAGMSTDDISSHMLPGEDRMTGGASFWIAADEDEIIAMMREVYTGEKQTTEGAITTTAVDN
jgi:LCP family protein required for cell wall assembly